jgi:hypothetical protein
MANAPEQGVFRLTISLLTVAIISSCAMDPQRAIWFDEFQAANRGESEAATRVAAFDSLARSAPTTADSCLAAAEAATRAVAGELPDGQLRNLRLLERVECKKHHAEARYRLLELAMSNGKSTLVDLHFQQLLLDYPDSLWARQGFELRWRLRKPGSAARLGQAYVSWYQKLARTSLAGHSLYYGAQALLDTPGARTSVTSESRQALYLLLLLVEHHTDSVRWDDGLVLAADLLAELGYRGDETRLLEEALLPHPSRGYDTLLDSFSARLRWRLSGLYLGQGKFEQALYQLELVVNVHDTLRLKDDALWRSARIYATLGRQDAERHTLMFLIEQCPWSRHLDAARERLVSVEEQ